LFDQGLLPRRELRKQLETFGAQVLPRYKDRHEKVGQQ